MNTKNSKRILALFLLANVAWAGINAVVKLIPPTPDTTLVLVNQVGYYPFDNDKRAILQIDFRPPGFENQVPFQVENLQNSAIALSGNLSYLGQLWGHYYYEVNISDLRIEGRYQVAVHTGVTYNSPLSISRLR